MEGLVSGGGDLDVAGGGDIQVDPNQTRADAYEGELICIKVKDVLGITPVCGTRTFLYRPHDTFASLFDDTARHFQINIGDFELVYQDKADLYELSLMPPELALTAAALNPSREKEYSVTINSVKKARKAKSRPQAHNKSISSSSSGGCGAGSSRVKETATELGGESLRRQQELEMELEREIQSLQRTKRAFVGLKNKNMTCYLNSVLQALWFTPEFRNIVYSCTSSSNQNQGKKTICQSLQKLFLRMQFSERESIETEELTSTFGWGIDDTWHQHDAEELCNLLMENLSLEFKETRLEGVIEALYFGLFTDYVKCLSCSKMNAREAPFLVIPLPIRHFDRRLQFPTLEEALATFTTPELLEGNNQYKCENCDKSTDAQKGLLFKKLPYILTIQLKRFEYDWMTNRRHKLNDVIIFPMALDMNPYMDTSFVEIGAEGGAEAYLKYDVFKSAAEMSSSMNRGVRTTHSRPTVPMPPQERGLEEKEPQGSLDPEPENEQAKALASSEVGVGADGGAAGGLDAEGNRIGTEETSERVEEAQQEVQNQEVQEGSAPAVVCGLGASRKDVMKALKEMTLKGPNVYQLFAVLVHRGGLQGGHYFAYILDFETFQWIRCDDSFVRKADIGDMHEMSSACFGGDEEDKEPSSAYMLMYRRFDESTNSLPLYFDGLHQSLKDLWNSLTPEEKVKTEEEELERNNIKIPVYFRIRFSLQLRVSEMYLLKAATTAGAALLVFKHFFPELPDPPAEHIRLCRFDKELGVIENSFEGHEDQYITYALKNPAAVCQNEGLIVQVIKEKEKFYPYHSNDLVFFGQLLDVELENIVGVDELHCSPHQTVGELRRLVAEKFHLEVSSTRIVLHDLQRNCLKLFGMDVDQLVLSEIKLLKTTHLFVQTVAPEEMNVFLECLTKFVNSIEFELEVESFLLKRNDVKWKFVTRVGKKEIPGPPPVYTGSVDTSIPRPQIYSGAVVKEAWESPDSNDPAAATSTPANTPTSSPKTKTSSPEEEFWNMNFLRRLLAEAEVPSAQRMIAMAMDIQQSAEEAHNYNQSGGDSAEILSLSSSGSEGTIVNTEEQSDENEDSSVFVEFEGTSSPASSLQPPVQPPTASSSAPPMPSSPAAPPTSPAPSAPPLFTSPEAPLMYSSFTFRRIPDDNLNSTWTRFVVRVDAGVKMLTMSKYLAHKLKCKEDEFIFVKSSGSGSGSEEIEILSYESIFESILPLDKLRVRMSRRLRKGEGRVSIFLLQLHDNPEQIGNYIGDVVLSGDMTAGAAKKSVIEQLGGFLEGCELNKCRLRKKLTDEIPSKIFREVFCVCNYLTRIHGDELYFQVLSEAEELGDKTYCMFIRRWRRSSWTLEPITEIKFFYDHSDHVANVLRPKLCESTGIPEADLEVAKPNVEFPFKMNPVGVEELVWTPLTETTPKSIYVYHDDVVFFIRDGSEALRKWSSEEASQFRKEMASENLKSLTSVRKEVGLKIKMKSP